MKKVIFYFVPLIIVAVFFVLVDPINTMAVATTPVQPTKAPEILICPAGYICNPIPAQPVDCPAGYICSPIKTGEGSSGGGSNGSSPVISSCYTFTTNLTIGSMGADVVALQSLLISKGYSISDISSGQVAKGYFGPSTANAVKAYQTANGIPSTGFVGPLTRAVLNALCTKDTVPPSMISVVSPKQGEVYDSNGQLKIQWTGYNGDFDYYQLILGNTKTNTEVQIDDGYRISKTQNSYGTFVLWSFVNQITKNSVYSADIIKNSYYIKVNAVKSDKVNGSIVNSGKSGIFSITSNTSSQSLITVKSPNGGEVYKTGDTVNINWQGGDSGARQISILPWSAMTNSNVSPVASITTSPDVNSYSWIIPTSVANGQYFVKIYCVGSCTSDSSDSYFTITSPTASVNSDLTVLTPVNPKNNTNIFSTGETLSLAWSSRYFGVNRIYLLSETGTQVATILATNDNGVFPYTGSTYSWKIPDNIPTGTYKVRVIIGINVQVADTGTFRIKNTVAEVQPTIKVLSPNGGEVWQIGQTYLISTISSGELGTKTIRLNRYSDDGMRVGAETIGTTNTNSFYYKVPAGTVETRDMASRYKVQVLVDKYNSGIGVADESDGYITIVSTTSTPIQDTSPTSKTDQSSLNASIWDAVNEYYKSNR